MLLPVSELYSFPWLNHIPLYIYIPYFVDPFIYRWTLGSFILLAILNNVLMNTDEQVSL